MLAINLQTSFLTPPFGFSLFYLKSVSPKKIKTTDIAFAKINLFLILKNFPKNKYVTMNKIVKTVFLIHSPEKTSMTYASGLIM